MSRAEKDYRNRMRRGTRTTEIKSRRCSEKGRRCAEQRKALEQKRAKLLKEHSTVFQEGYAKGRECGYAEGTREATSADEARSARDQAFADGRIKGVQEGRGEGNHHFWELGRQSGLEEAARKDDGFKRAFEAGRQVGINSGYAEGYEKGSTESWKDCFECCRASCFEDGFTKGRISARLQTKQSMAIEMRTIAIT